MTTETSNTADVIIIGGGPAGLSAGFWCYEMGLKAILLEKENEFGGQLLSTHNRISNYLGLEAANGREMRDRFVEYSEQAEYERVLTAEVASADLRAGTIALADGRELSARAVIIATGVRRRRLGIPGEKEFRGRGVLDSGVGEKEKITGKRVMIVGGGDAALENALLLSETAQKVVVVHRRNEFTARAEFLDRARRTGNVDLIGHASVSAILGESSVDAVSIRDGMSREQVTIPVEAILVRIGVQPNTEIFDGQVALDGAGYILVDNTCVASLPRVFAIGDVANPTTPTLSGAVGTGATAAKAIVSFGKRI